MKRTQATTLTQKGQVTVPIEIRKRLGLKARDRVVFEMQGDVVIMRPAHESGIRKWYGSVPPHSRPEDFETIRDAMQLQMAVEIEGDSR